MSHHLLNSWLQSCLKTAYLDFFTASISWGIYCHPLLKCHECIYCKRQFRCHSYHPNASSERTSIKPDTRPPWGELEGDEKDEGRQTGALNQSD